VGSGGHDGRPLGAAGPHSALSSSGASAIGMKFRL
jgi:hypothetical protein